MVMSYKRYSAEDVARILTEDTEIPEISLEEVNRILTEDTEIPEISNPNSARCFTTAMKVMMISIFRRI